MSKNDSVDVEDDDFDIGISELSSSGKVIQTARFMLTYKTHIDKVDMSKFLTKMYNDNKLKINIAHETSDKKNSYEHTHVVVDLGFRTKMTNLKKFDYNGIHPNLLCLYRMAAYKRCLVYISKQDKTAVPELETDGKSLYKKIIECDTLEVALDLYVKKPGEASGIISMYNTKNYFDPVNVITDLYYWQQYVFDIVCRANGKRTIYWIVDIIGNRGKSELALYICSKFLGDSLLLTSGDVNMRDMSWSIVSARKSNNKLGIVICDIPRHDVITPQFYTGVEAIRNGCVSTQKYSGGTVSFNNRCCIVFSNRFPDKGAWSSDRLVLINIDHIKPPVIDDLDDKDNVLISDKCK